MSDRRIPGKGLKDENGFYTNPTLVASKEPSVDALLRDGLTACQSIMDTILLSVRGGQIPERETVMNLKDLMGILQDMKKKQLDATKDASDEELEAELARRKTE